MKKQMKTLSTIVVATLLLNSCSLQQRLTGTWNIVKFQETNINQQNAEASNVGTIQFKKDGSGIKSLSYSILGNQTNDQKPFTWTINGQNITLNSDNAQFPKSWIIVTNKAKYQVWKTTDGQGNIQKMELKKQ
ncbi:lipocalin family protein [Hydrotalea sp.]|uniref:lipocalin family protein n=1 Tax=Hydrotalea sp. TaxID=2881279 RepID=UPI00258C2719|nr:lipocalin family protein [Hydrotalea sp.]